MDPLKQQLARTQILHPLQAVGLASTRFRGRTSGFYQDGLLDLKGTLFYSY